MAQTVSASVRRADPPGQQSLAASRQGVRDLMLRCPAFRTLPADRQREIARHTVEIVNYLAAPEGIPAARIATARKGKPGSDPYALALAQEEEGTAGFTARGAREGAKVAGLLLREVNFPEFVSGLIDGVFNSIVTSSIKQMEAYGQLVADVAKTLNEFRDENVSDNQGRDHLVEKFPDLFRIDVDTGDGTNARPRVRLQDGVDETAALQRVNGSLPTGEAPLESLDLEDEETEQKLVQTARTQLASSRQQLLATMVLMGINRIVVTSGRIAAKVNYRFQAMDTWQSSATQFDYGNVGTQIIEEQDPRNRNARAGYAGAQTTRDATWWSKGKYRRTELPLVKLTGIEASQTDAQLEASAALAGEVNVQFKSETLPLEKMADSFQISQIQQASRRNRSESQPAT